MCLYKQGNNYITHIFISFCPVYCFFSLSIYETVISSDCAKDSANRHSMLHTASPTVNTTDSSTSLSLLFICISRPFLLPWFQSPPHQFCHKFFFLPQILPSSSELHTKSRTRPKERCILNTAKPGVDPPKEALCNQSPRNQTWNYRIWCLPYWVSAFLVLVQFFLAVPLIPSFWNGNAYSMYAITWWKHKWKIYQQD